MGSSATDFVTDVRKKKNAIIARVSVINKVLISDKVSIKIKNGGELGALFYFFCQIYFWLSG
jgi:hypothetical protein